MGYSILVINWQDIKNPLGGGAEVHLHEIFKRIQAMGHQVTLLCCRHPDLPDEEVLDGIHIIRYGNRNFFNYKVPHLYKKLSGHKHFDIVIDDINKIPFYSPLFVNKPLIGIIHHLFGSSIFIEAPLPIAVYVTLAEKLIPSVYRKIPMAVVSNSTKNELIEKGFSADQLHLVYNAVDSSFYKFVPEKKHPNPLIGYLGRIKKYKSVDHLIMAFAEVRKTITDAELLVIGDGDYLPELKKLVNKLDLDEVVNFAGSASHDKKIEYLNQMWFMVNPSPKEGWGLTVIEGNSCGLPVIAADSPGLRDSVVDGETGFLYPYGDYQRLAKIMTKLIQDDQLRNSFTQKCINWAAKFNWEQSAQDMLMLIENVMSRRESNAE